MSKKQLVILSGPSCAGKGPLHACLERFYPELGQKLRKLTLYNTRDARPGETDGVDYHFRPRPIIQGLRDDPNFIVMDVRGDLQALDRRDITGFPDDAMPFFEGNAYVGVELLKLTDVDTLSVFLAPLCQNEIIYLRQPELRVDLQAFVTDIMRRRLLRRTQRQKTILALPDLENIERRARSALREMKEAWQFDHVIPCHDGEDSENWDAFYYPVGDARKAMLSLAGLLHGETPDNVEHWNQELLADS